MRVTYIDFFCLFVLLVLFNSYDHDKNMNVKFPSLWLSSITKLHQNHCLKQHIVKR